MNIPFHSVHLITYELLQDRLNYARTYDPLSHVISGAVAGAIAAAITTPLDVCKTLLNIQECCLAPTGESPCTLSRNPTVTAARTTSTVIATEEAKGLITAVRVIYVQGGLTAFFKGLTPRILYQMPSTAVAWSCYEFFVSNLSKLINEEKYRRIFCFLEAYFCWKTNNIMTCLIVFQAGQ
jgi:solute carrier family 25 iron transporter 28/37